MSINLFNNDSTKTSSLIPQTDADKFQKIAEILSSKRKTLEEKLEKEGADATDEERLELRDLIEEMKTFGIGEIEYAKWLVVEAKEGR